MEPRHLQVDHRVPHLVRPDAPDAEHNPDDFQLLCAPCNRAKSYTCEQCPNALTERDPKVCGTCFLSGTADPTHMATRPQRRLNLLFEGQEVDVFDELSRKARETGEHLGDFIKARVAEINEVAALPQMHPSLSDEQVRDLLNEYTATIYDNIDQAEEAIPHLAGLSGEPGQGIGQRPQGDTAKDFEWILNDLGARMQIAQTPGGSGLLKALVAKEQAPYLVHDFVRNLTHLVRWNCNLSLEAEPPL